MVRGNILDAIVINEAKAYLMYGATIRSVAKEFARSKTTVAYDLRNRVATSGRPDLQALVDEKLTRNASEAPYLGGIATQSKADKRWQVDGNE